ncbi:Variant surface glycoprotein [Trypanosoma congolense IL3000]|uniref:Variant surface glycoprotein n=1 Tax=Trypanosoma congolense (strain IL3000) TaxID=1068625 RepID=F9WB82_TRYCI|nr:Variant surface glycoprotein [Trypanosoma congolense IL3000]
MKEGDTMNVIKVSFVGLLLCLESGRGQPSKDEFNLFCRILVEANDMILEQDYAYDERKEREVLKQMEVLYNATTDSMNEFGKMLWKMRNFFEEHPPPMQLKNRQEARKEIGMLIADGERKIQENRHISRVINKKMEEAKVSVLQGMYGQNVKGVPKDDGEFITILRDKESIFVDNTTVGNSCGKHSASGKTLINDIFCVCVGEGNTDGNSVGPCHTDILPPRKNNNDGRWTQMKYEKWDKDPIPLTESVEKIEYVCRELLGVNNKKGNMPALLQEFVGMIGKGEAKPSKNNIFGQSGRIKGNGNNNVTECTGAGKTGYSGTSDYHNENICVDYTHNYKNNKYEIPWHNKFKHSLHIMKEAKEIEGKVLQNRAEILILKTKAWCAYGREREDETANIDDISVTVEYGNQNHFSLLFIICFFLFL